MTDNDSDETRRFMNFLDRNAAEIREHWPRWKADAFRLVKDVDEAANDGQRTSVRALVDRQEPHDV